MINPKIETEKAVFYLRVSTTKQGIDGLGIRAQEDMCEARAAESGLKCIGVFKEVESGRKSKRPQWLAAQAMAKKENAIIIVAAMSRLTRDFNFMTHVAEAAERDGIGIVACDVPQMSDPSQTKFIWRIMAAVAEMEVDNVRSRTKRGLNRAQKDLATKGEYWTTERKDKPSRRITSLGNPKLSEVRAKGSRNMKKNAKAFALTVYPAIEKIIKQTGQDSYRHIARCLSAQGVLTFQDENRTQRLEPGQQKPWGPEQVKRVINSAKGVKK